MTFQDVENVKIGDRVVYQCPGEDPQLGSVTEVCIGALVDETDPPSVEVRYDDGVTDTVYGDALDWLDVLG